MPEFFEDDEDIIELETENPIETSTKPAKKARPPFLRPIAKFPDIKIPALDRNRAKKPKIQTEKPEIEEDLDTTERPDIFTRKPNSFKNSDSFRKPDSRPNILKPGISTDDFRLNPDNVRNSDSFRNPNFVKPDDRPNIFTKPDTTTEESEITEKPDSTEKPDFAEKPDKSSTESSLRISNLFNRTLRPINAIIRRTSTTSTTATTATTVTTSTTTVSTTSAPIETISTSSILEQIGIDKPQADPGVSNFARIPLTKFQMASEKSPDSQDLPTQEPVTFAPDTVTISAVNNEGFTRILEVVKINKPTDEEPEDKPNEEPRR